MNRDGTIPDVIAEIGPYRPINDINKPVKWPVPNPHQREFIESKVPFPAMWGGKGGAKTWGLVMRTISLLVDSPWHGDMSGNRGFLGRLEWQALKGSTMREFFRLLPPQWIKHYNKADRVVELYNKSECILGHFSDITSILSLNLGFAGFDQLEQMDLEMWEEFSMMRVRMTQKLNGEDLGYRSCFGVGNPPGPAHWCYLWEANRLAQGTPLENKDYFTVNVTTMDNKDNLPEGYIERAKRNLSDRKFRIHFLGSWEALEGQVFSEFSHKDHCHDHDEIPKAHWQKFIAIDYGRTAGHSATFLAIDDDNNLLVYDEAYIEDALVEDHAGLIKNKLDQHKREIEMEYGKCGDEDHIPEIWYHDPSMVRRADQKGERSGESITLVGLYLEALAIKGIEVGMIPANNEIDAGIDRVNFVLRHNRLRFNKRVKHHVAQISSYIYDEKTGKPRSRQKDHCCDTLRYAVSAIFDLIVFPVEEEKPTMVDRIIAQMRERNSSPFDDILESEVF